MASPKKRPVPLDTEVDFGRYACAPPLPAAQCMPFALLLARAAPRDLSPLERARLDGVSRAAREVQDVVDARSAAGTGRVRPRLDALARAWACGSTLLDGYARLEGPRGARAAALQSVLLRGGLSFLSGSADAVWFEADRRLARLRSESSRDELIAIIGDDATAWIERATSELGDVIGCGCRPAPAKDAGLLARTIRELQRAIVAYARAVGSTVSTDDPASVERFRRAMAPLDDFRFARRRPRARASERPLEELRRETDATPETQSR